MWTIAGSDSCSGAGVQADLATFQAFDAYGCNVITAITSQNALGVQAIDFVSEETIISQINALYSNLKPVAIKIGMLGSTSIARSIFKIIQSYNVPIIVDPILFSGFNQSLIKNTVSSFVEMLKEFFSFVFLLTPNIPEAEMILNRQLRNKANIEIAAQEFIRLGCKNVLIKGGHLKEGINSEDYFTDGKVGYWITSTKVANRFVHGTGCILSAAITATLAKGFAVKDAVVIGKHYITQTIASSQQIGEGISFAIHPKWLNLNVEFPKITALAHQNNNIFPNCGPEPLGLYPVVDHVKWIERLLSLGVKTIQLRIKNQSDIFIKEQIKESVFLVNKYKAKLFINDYWQWAIEYGAYGVHLGQEDLLTADINKIYTANLRLGISTHSYFELATALFYKPSYIALGPIFATTTKKMPFQPQGIATLKRWRELVYDCQLVAIGGIDIANLTAVLNTKTDGVAVVSAILKDPEPQQKTLRFLEVIRNFKSNYSIPNAGAGSGC